MAKFSTAEAINKEIAAIRTAGAKFDKRVQDCALSCLEHFEAHGDYTLLVSLYQALPKGSRRGSFATWILKYSRLAANTDKDTKAEKPFVLDKAKKNDLEGAAAEFWYEAGKPEQSPDEVFDLQKAVLALLAKAKAAKDHGRKVKGLDADTVRALEALKAE